MALAGKITMWKAIQSLYMPAASLYREAILSPAHPTPSENPFADTASTPEAEKGASSDDDDDDGEDILDDSQDTSTLSSIALDAENYELYLPSHSISLSRSFASKELLDKERRLRIGRLEGHLTELRKLLRIKTGAILHKKANSVGQKSGTRSNTLLSDFAAKIELTASHYSEEREVALRLDPDGEWRHRLRLLQKKDIRGIQENEVENVDILPRGREVWNEAQRTISWIWKVPRIQGSDDAEVISLEEEESEIGEGKVATFYSLHNN